MRGNTIAFSVLMSVYARENPAWFDHALASVWDEQTLKPDQIVLVKDGHLTDMLDQVVFKWKQKLGDVLTVAVLSENAGLANALNKGLEHCKHDLVARMDTDDISLPQRFEKQIGFMMNHSDVAVSSAMIEEIYPTMETFADSEPAFKHKSIRKIPLTHTEILRFAKYRNPVNHPVSVFCKRAVLAVGGYPVFMKAQDYALWSLMLKNNYQFANVDEVLLKMRCGDNLMRKRDMIYFKQEFNVLKYQRKIEFINNYEFAKNVIMRFCVRSAPDFIKKIIYGFVRQYS